MMGRLNHDQGRLFYSFCLADAVPDARGGAKGNAVRGSTRQTQSWESLSPALDRIRDAARREKKFGSRRCSITSPSICSAWNFHQSRSVETLPNVVIGRNTDNSPSI